MAWLQALHFALYLVGGQECCFYYPAIQTGDKWRAAAPSGPIRIRSSALRCEGPLDLLAFPQPYRFSLGSLRIQEGSFRAGSLRSPAPHSEGPLDLLRVSAASLEALCFDLAFTPLPTMRRREPPAPRSAICCHLFA